MHSFHYTQGSLHCENVSLGDLAKEHGTPLYVYSAATFRDRYTSLDSAFEGLDHEVAYAVKANSNLSASSLISEVALTSYPAANSTASSRLVATPPNAPSPESEKPAPKSSMLLKKASTPSTWSQKKKPPLLAVSQLKWTSLRPSPSA
jgi:hypothetical protein